MVSPFGACWYSSRRITGISVHADDGRLSPIRNPRPCALPTAGPAPERPFPRARRPLCINGIGRPATDSCSANNPRAMASPNCFWLSTHRRVQPAPARRRSPNLPCGARARQDVVRPFHAPAQRRHAAGQWVVLDGSVPHLLHRLRAQQRIAVHAVVGGAQPCAHAQAQVPHRRRAARPAAWPVSTGRKRLSPTVATMVVPCGDGVCGGMCDLIEGVRVRCCLHDLPRSSSGRHGFLQFGCNVNRVRTPRCKSPARRPR